MESEDSIILEDVPVITPTGDIIVAKLSLEVMTTLFILTSRWWDWLVSKFLKPSV